MWLETPMVDHDCLCTALFFLLPPKCSPLDCTNKKCALDFVFGNHGKAIHFCTLLIRARNPNWVTHLCVRRQPQTPTKFGQMASGQEETTGSLICSRDSVLA